MRGFPPEDERRSGSTPGNRDPEQFEVDESLEETFPASDPPAWTLGRTHHKEAENPEAKESGENQQ